jgi:hypothetical protein
MLFIKQFSWLGTMNYISIYLSVGLSLCVSLIAGASTNVSLEVNTKEGSERLPLQLAHKNFNISDDDLTFAVLKKPEFESLFDLFVSIQVMKQAQVPKKDILNKVYQLRESVLFVQKYSQDPLLARIIQWCESQEGFVARKVSAWKKALIVGASVVGGAALIAFALFLKRLKNKAKVDSKIVLPNHTAPVFTTPDSSVSPTPAVSSAQSSSSLQPSVHPSPKLEIERRDPSRFLTPNWEPLVLCMDKLGVVCDDINTLPFFTAWKTVDGGELTRNIASFSTVGTFENRVPLVIQDFIRSDQLGSLKNIIITRPDLVKGVGYFISAGRFFVSLTLETNYFLWEVGSSLFVPIDLSKAKIEERLPHEVITLAMPYSQKVEASSCFLNRRFVYRHSAQVLFYTTRPEVICSILTTL